MGAKISQGDSGSISHLPSQGSEAMNNHGSLKSICSECVARIKFYPKNDRVDDLIRRREFVC